MPVQQRHANPDTQIRGSGRYYPPDSTGDPQTRFKDGYSDQKLWEFMHDIRYEPQWRGQAEIDAAFYDGDQLRSETLTRMQELGIPPIVVNMSGPLVDSVTGWESIARADLKCIPENEESYEIAKAVNVKYKEAMRLTKFDYQVGLQFKDSTRIGVGWLEVSRQPDPFKYPYRVNKVPWRQMYVDYQSRDEDYSDARYMIRRQWHDADMLKQSYPKESKYIDAAMGGFRDSWLMEWEATGYSDYAYALAQNLEQERRTTLEEDEWKNTERSRIAMYEILYTVPRPVEVLRLQDGSVVELDPDSPAQMRALATGFAKYQAGVTKEWRQAMYIGPHRVSDIGLELNMPHYIPMVAWRKDGDGTPYGLMRRLRSPQEAYNARYARMLYDMSSRKYMADDDAFDNHDETAKELNKANSYVIKRGDSMGPGLTELNTADMAAITYQLLEQAKVNFYDVTGLSPEWRGLQQSAGQPGVAIDQFIHQTTQVLGSVTDNYRNSKERSGMTLFGFVLADLYDVENHEVETDDEPKRKIVLNARAASGERTNVVLMAKMRIALGEVPASQTYLQQKLQSLSEIVKSMPPEVQPLFLDLIIRAAALDDGEELLERVREATGYGPEPKDPQKRKALADQKQQAAELQQRHAELELELREAEVMQAKAKAEESMQRAKKIADSDTELTEAKTLVELAKAGDVETQASLKEKETQAKLIESAARLEKERNAEKKAAADKKNKKT